MWIRGFAGWLAGAEVETLAREEAPSVDSTPAPTLKYDEPRVSIAKHTSKTKNVDKIFYRLD